MTFFKGLNFKTIRSRIIVLCSFGIIGLFTAGIISKYLVISIGRDLTISKFGEAIQQDILNIMLIEEKFVGKRDPGLIPKHDDLEKKLLSSIRQLQNSDSHESIKACAETVLKTVNSHLKVFTNIRDNILNLNQNRKLLHDRLIVIRASLSGIISLLDNEETDLMLKGEFLDLLKNSLRSEVKDLLSIYQSILLNIEDMLLYSAEEKYKAAIAQNMDILEKKSQNASSSLKSINIAAFDELWKKVEESLPEMNKLESSIYKDWLIHKQLEAEQASSYEKVRQAAFDIAKLTRETIEDRILTSDRINMIVLISGIFILLTVSFLMFRKIMRSIQDVILGLNDSTEQITNSAMQVATASQSLAEVNSEQAAASEEMSSSLEEVSFMVRQNAEHAVQTDKFMEDVIHIVEKVLNAMNRLKDSMEVIIKAGKETSGLVKTIDGIAFQTNLLALNAAIEAARAGNAGGGFAIVADEVRRLAMRASDAARNTSTLIDGALEKTQSHGEILSEARECFIITSDYSYKIGKLIDLIAKTSEEQSLRIAQLNNAVKETDKITQNNAANSEETVSASEELKAQVEKIKLFVNALTVLIGKKA